MKPRCSIYVTKRHYGHPGQRESRRAVKRIQIGDMPILACVGHRNLITAGGKPAVAQRSK